MINYNFRRAHEANAFQQFPLITPSKLRKGARDRGIGLPPSGLLEKLERFDREGAFSPILFDVAVEDGTGAIVFRDERDYVPWSEYADGREDRARPRPYYAPWQFLYLNDAVELPTISVDIEWLLDDEQRGSLGPNWRTFLGDRLQLWRGLDRRWRDILLVLLLLQSRYGPSVKGSLLRSTVSLVRDPQTGESVDPRILEPPLDAQRVLDEFGLTTEALKKMHRDLASHGMMMDGDDPLGRWYMLFRMAPAAQRATLRGRARRAQDAYDAAEMLRSFYYDLTGELLLNPDEIFDASDKSWKRRLFDKWPTRSYSRADLAVELRRRDLHPYQVHLVVEGDTEKIVCPRVLEGLAGMPLTNMGVSIHDLHGVGGLLKQRDVLRAMKLFPRYLILVADREGDVEREVKRLKDEGVLTDETAFLWETSFEEANFSYEEIIGMIAAIGEGIGATLTLDAQTLRTRFSEHRSRVGADAEALAEFALRLARQPEHGSVRTSKRQLADPMADLILDDLRQRDAHVVSADRPIVSVLISVLRVI